MVDFMLYVRMVQQMQQRQRAYHLDELKDTEKLKIDADYYLAHQMNTVVTIFQFFSFICIKNRDTFYI